MGVRRPRGFLLGSAVLATWGALTLFAAALAAADGDDWLLGVAMGIGAWVLLGVLWWPRRPREPDPAATVVVRPAWWLRLGGTLAGVIGLGLWAGLLGLVEPAGDDSVRVTGAGGVLLAVVLGAIGTLGLLATWVAWWMRQSVSPDEVTVRVLGPTSRIAADHPAASVRAEDVVLHAGRAGGRVPVPRVVVESVDARGRPVRAGFDAASTRFDEALAVLEGWTTRRTDLVAADDERTRSLLAGEVRSGDGRRARRRDARGR